LREALSKPRNREHEEGVNGEMHRPKNVIDQLEMCVPVWFGVEFVARVTGVGTVASGEVEKLVVCEK
jgi:hypothetical protein